MDMLLAMRTAAAIADLGSFTLAAERLGLSRAMTSKHIADLEAHLRVRLFNRTTRRLSLTEAGSELVEKFRGILELIDETGRTAADHARQPSGLLRLSAPMSFGIAHIAPRIAPYLEANPAAAVDLSLNDRVVDLIEEGYDLAIRIGTLADSSLIATRIAATRLFVVAAPAYLARHGPPATLAEIAGHQILHYAQGAPRQSWTFESGGKRTTTPALTSRIKSNNGDALMRMACGGAGLAFQPDFIIADAVREGLLEVVLPDIATQTLGIFAIYPASQHVPLKTRAFIDHLKACFAGRPPWSIDLPEGTAAEASQKPKPRGKRTTTSTRGPRKASRSP